MGGRERTVVRLVLGVVLPRKEMMLQQTAGWAGWAGWAVLPETEGPVETEVARIRQGFVHVPPVAPAVAVAVAVPVVAAG